MAVNVVRYSPGGDGGDPAWGVVERTSVRPVAGSFATTGDFMTGAAAAVRSGDADLGPPVGLDQVTVVCPVTSDQQFVCQAVNYRGHMSDSGLSPETSPFNIFFRKASSCLAPADTDIVSPAHVELLDYEVEIGLVLSQRVDGPVTVTADALGEHVGALVLVDDVSARDVQIPEGQFYKGKSYRTFGPVGPWLTLVDQADLDRFAELHLRLSVNGEVRQDDFASDMVHAPAPSLTELSQLQDWGPGDLLATGTPGGCAMRAPAKPIAVLAQAVSPKRRAALMRKAAARNERRLRPGDEVVATVRTDDGAIDLGEQRNAVVAAG